MNHHSYVSMLIKDACIPMSNGFCAILMTYDAVYTKLIQFQTSKLQFFYVSNAIISTNKKKPQELFTEQLTSDDPEDKPASSIRIKIINIIRFS